MTEEKPEPAELADLETEATVPAKRPARRMSGEVTVPISRGSRDKTTVFEPDAVEAKAIQGPLRRNAPLIVVMGVALIVGPWVSQLLSSYRAVVLEVRGDQMLLIEGRTPPPPPRWVDAIDTEGGDIVLKSAGSWSPEVVEAAAADRALMSFHERWSRTYDGVITAIRPPDAPGAPSVAVLRLEDGSGLNVALWSQGLAEATVGKRLIKIGGSWEPTLSDAAPVDSRAADSPADTVSPSPAD